MDFLIFSLLNNLAGKYQWLDYLIIFFARYFEFFLVVFVVVFFRKRVSVLLTAFSAAIFSRFILVEAIRLIWFRPRPFVNREVILLLPYDASKAAFPSGHAAFYFALSTIVYIYNKKAGYFCFAASFLISIARVFAGVHWLSDIIGGIVVGVVGGYFLNNLLKKATF